MLRHALQREMGVKRLAGIACGNDVIFKRGEKDGLETSIIGEGRGSNRQFFTPKGRNKPPV